MTRAKDLPHDSRRGSTLILSLIFIAMFAALGVALATMSGANVQVAQNHRNLANARAGAESGLEVVRYWMSKVAMSGTIDPSLRFSTLAGVLQNELTTAGITNLSPVYGGTTITLSSSNVPLNSSAGQSFSAVLTKINDDNIQLDVTGYYGSLSRTIRSNYIYGERPNNVFDFGVATKGPLSLAGNIDMEGANIDIESNAYIQTDDLLALEIIGNSHIAGTVQITNPNAYVDLQGGQAGIGGVTGEAATQPPYTSYGVPPTEFPEMFPDGFSSYVASNILDPNATTSNVTLANVTIPAGMNPNFTGQTTLQGVIWIESPNVVVFGGNTTVCGMIIGDGDQSDDSGTNTITFTSTVNTTPMSSLPQEPQFQGLHDELGTFIMAPGFAAKFTGGFGTLSGAIAANGIEFSGQAGGTINGSIINYSGSPMVLSGSNDLFFNRSGLIEVPAGFVPEIVLYYDPSNYSEVVI